MVTTTPSHTPSHTHYHAYDEVPGPADDELARYVFFDEAGLHVGTLSDYAKAWEDASAFGYYLSGEVRTWYATHTVDVTYIGTDDNDYRHYRLTANDETVYAAIDGRA